MSENDGWYNISMKVEQVDRIRYPVEIKLGWNGSVIIRYSTANLSPGMLVIDIIIKSCHKKRLSQVPFWSVCNMIECDFGRCYPLFSIFYIQAFKILYGGEIMNTVKPV